MIVSYGYYKDQEDLGYNFRTDRMTLADVHNGIKKVLSKFICYSCGAILVNEHDRKEHSPHTS